MAFHVLRRFLRWVVGGIWQVGLGAAVTAYARQHLTAFGLRNVREEYGGLQYTVELEHCEISYWLYKNDLGSAIRPLSHDPGVSHSSVQIAEESISGRSISSEVERQMRLVVQNYLPILEGIATDWPVEEPSE